MESLLASACRELLHEAGDALLAQPLDALAARIDDDEARELFLALHASGTGDRLRDMLERGSLLQFVAETCTEREEQALYLQLSRWLGRGASGGDDPERLVQVPAPPHDGAQLLAWADQHGVTRELARPLSDLWPEQRDARTIAELCLAEPGAGRTKQPASELLAHARKVEAAHAFLRARAARTLGAEAREALHARRLSDGPLGLLARRLRALFQEHTLSDLALLRFVPARPVTLDLATGTAEGTLVASDPDGIPERMRIHLSGFEQRAPAHHCSRCEGRRCAHVAALAARLFEGCVAPSDRLHDALTRFVEVPSWQRFLRALGPALDAPRERALFFRVRIDGALLSVGVLAGSEAPSGRPRTEKLVSPAKLARSARVQERERSLLGALAARSRSLTPSYVPVDAQLLRALVDHPSLQTDSGQPLSLEEQAVEVTLRELPDGLSPEVTLCGAALAPVALRGGAPACDYVFHFEPERGSLTFAPLSPALQRLLEALVHFRGTLPPESFPALAAHLGPLREVAHVTTPKALDGYDRPPPERLLLRITPRLDEGIDLSLVVRTLPLAPLWLPGQGPRLVHGLEAGVPCSVRRDLAAERERAASITRALALDELLSLGPFRYRVETTEAALELLSRAARLNDQLELEWAERARPLRIVGSVQSADLKIQLFKRGDFCAIEGHAQKGELTVAVERLLEAARSGERFVPIEGGDYVEIERELFERLSLAQLCMLPRIQDLKLPSAAVLPLFDALGSTLTPGDSASAAWLALARGGLSEPALAPPALALPLRSYQREGAAWLLQRSGWAPGVCLADEMGLGKTAQTIALLVARASEGPALVLAPTSVVDNWLVELSRFAPALEGRCYRGAERERLLDALGPGVVLVTSYELMLRDTARLTPHAFATLVLDEAQVLKNARTQRARAALALSARFRVALSGTPVENRLGDLWSLFHLLAPGLLGSWSRFRARFAVPIERYENDAREEALRGLVSPFILRRTKREVERELPARTDVVHLVELTQAERDLYDAALAHARRALGKRRRADDTSRTVQILAELTRLRQLACHPRLVLDDARVSSSKLSSLLTLLDDLLPRGHRVLLFSQFVRHLALVREALDARGVASLTLDGSTPAGERSARVARFQALEAPVFLISLKAGGTGLNLTAADYVVHLDPWWNPSAEDQASDRAHRLGQERPVTVVKLVAQGTIEERVLALHAHKRRLAELVLDAGSHRDLTESDLALMEALVAE